MNLTLPESTELNRIKENPRFMRFLNPKQIIKEAEARIQHAEDFVIFNGSKGMALL